ncbi:MAG: tetratricopeptide repeat protein [Candidatus Omnitrophota bacterium]
MRKNKYMISQKESIGYRQHSKVSVVLAGLLILILGKVNPCWGQEIDYLWENFLKGDYYTVISNCEGMKKKNLSDKLGAEFYYLMGMSYLYTGDSIFARNSFNFLLEKYPHSDWSDSAKIALGDCFLMERNFTEAVETYQSFIDKNKKSPLLSLAYFKLAETRRKQGLWDDAKKLHEKIKSLFPNSLEAKLSNDILSNNEFFYTLQVGSFINKENALRVVEDLNSQSIPAYISEFVKLGRIYYRVRVGRFLDSEECEKMRKKLIGAGYTPYIYP